MYPQVQKMSPGYDYEAANSVHALSREVEDFPTYEPDLDHFIVHGKAKLSDLLSVSVIYGGLLISKRFKTLLENFCLPKHKFYAAKVHHKKQFYEYYWMHIICDLTIEIDYKKSSFINYYNYAHNLGSVSVSSKEELEEKRKKIKAENPGKNVTIWAERLWLRDSFNEQLDLFEIGSFDANTYISSRLRNKIDAEKITGCHIIPASNIFINESPTK